MEKASPTVNKGYIIGVTCLIVVAPLLSAYIELIASSTHVLSWSLLGKWFIFFAVGIRLLIAGIKQTSDPAFTAKKIFHIDSTEALPIVRELGFANICFGLVGMVSLFIPQWRIVSAFGSGLYYGIAGIQHLLKKIAGPNELFALVSDLVIFVILAIYVVSYIWL